MNDVPAPDAMSLEEKREHDRAKVVRGRDGWLFLHRDTNRVMEQQAGTLRLAPVQLRRWRHALELRTAWLERHGIPYFFLIVPNAASVYPEKMPEGFETVDDRPVNQLLGHLASTGSFAQAIQPLEELIAAKRERLTYIPTDTHWSEFGAFVGYERLADEMERRGVALRRLRSTDLRIEERTLPGDLGRKLDPPASSTHVFAEPREPAARMVSDNRVYNNGRTIVYECPEAPGRCFVHGDSLAYAMLHFLGESFGRLFYVHRPVLDFEAVLEERPSAVVSVITERFIVRVPHDQPYAPLERVVAERRERGAILPPDKPSPLRVTQEVPPHLDLWVESE